MMGVVVGSETLSYAPPLRRGCQGLTAVVKALVLLLMSFEK